MATTSASDTGAPAIPGQSGSPCLTGTRALAPLDERILDAAIRCIGRWGLAKTTLDDVAREAGCSRTTVYRVFPGGKDNLLLAAAQNEILAFCCELGDELAGCATLSEVLSLALAKTVTTIRQHEVLQYLLAHEPGTILPFIAFDGIDPLLSISVDVLAPHIERHLGCERTSREVAEWIGRLVVSYAFEPGRGTSPAHARHVGEADEARRFVTTFVLPGIAAGHAAVTASVPGSAPVPGPVRGPSPGVLLTGNR